MGVKRQHKLKALTNERHLDQYVATFDYSISIEQDGVPAKILDYCDEEFGQDNWDWHFKVVGVKEEYTNGNRLDTEAYISFKKENDALEFWWWWQGNE